MACRFRGVGGQFQGFVTQSAEMSLLIELLAVPCKFSVVQPHLGFFALMKPKEADRLFGSE